MARLKNIVSAKVKGNTGAVAFRKRTDAIIVAERSYTNSAKADNATATQRIHRLRWTNVVEFYNSIKPILKRAWEGPVSQLTSWNHFTKANLSTSPVFLTKQEAALHAAVIAPYIVSRGRLTPVKGEYGQDRFLTNIKLGQSADISTMSVADFATAIVANNDGWQYGDKLSICRLQQLMVNKSGTIIPKIAASYLEISLDPGDSSPISSVVGWSSFAPNIGAYGDLIITLAGDATFGIHSRLSNGMLYVSAQDVVLRDPESCIYQKYTGEDQLAAAMDSYGFRSLPSLTPTSGEHVEVPVFYDYLESDGLAYIDTLYTANVESSFLVDYMILDNFESPSVQLLGNLQGQSSSNIGFNISITRSSLARFFSSTVRVPLQPLNERKRVLLSKYGLSGSINLNFQDIVTTGETISSVTLFRAIGSLNIGKIRIFEAMIYENDVLVRHFKPCTFDSIPGMWDKVSRTFFSNSNTEGAFTVGNIE